ncbi:MAG: alpha/beta hydrolase [Defluviitaleaceae bacterium]|nr:alpha/beta hydrolase [Defluviitaleaceae bacterium]
MECLINDLPIYYEEYGSGRPILCLHRFTEDHGLMKGCIEPLFRNIAGYRRIYLDMPGMGKTPAKDWIKNADIMLDTLKKFVDKVIGNEGFLLIGASYGAYMSLGMAYDTNMKIEGMFLFNPCTVPDSEKRNVPDDVETFEEEGIEEFIEGEDVENSDYFFDEAVVLTKETWSRYKNEVLPAYKLTNTEFCENYRENGYAFSFNSELQDLQFPNPVTVFTGRQDDSAGYEDSWKLLKHLPCLTFIALDGVGPLMQIENPEAFNFHLEGWLKRIN